MNRKFFVVVLFLLFVFVCSTQKTYAITSVPTAPKTIKAYSGGMLYGSNYYSDLTTRFSKKLYGSGQIAFCTGTLAQDAPNETMNNRTELDAGYLYILKSQCKAGQNLSSCYKGSDKKQYITQIAIWRYIEDNYKNKRNNPNLSNGCAGSGVTCSYNSGVSLEKNVIKNLLKKAKEAKKTGYQSSTFSVKPKSSNLTLKGSYYQSEVMKASCKNISSYKVSVSSPYQVVNGSGKAQTAFKCSEKFAIRIPSSKVTKNTDVSIKISATSTVERAYEYYPSSKSSYVQPIIISGTYPYELSISLKLSVVRSCSCKGDYNCTLSYCKNASNRKKCATSCGVKDPGFTKCSSEKKPTGGNTNCNNKKTVSSEYCIRGNSSTYYKSLCAENSTIEFKYKNLPIITNVVQNEVNLNGSNKCTLTFEKAKWNYDYLISTDSVRTNLKNKLSSYNKFNVNSNGLSNLRYNTDAKINMVAEDIDEESDSSRGTDSKVLVRSSEKTTTNKITSSSSSKVISGDSVYNSRTYISAKSSIYLLPGVCIAYATGVEYNPNNSNNCVRNNITFMNEGPYSKFYINLKSLEGNSIITVQKDSLKDATITNTCSYKIEKVTKEESPPDDIPEETPDPPEDTPEQEETVVLPNIVYRPIDLNNPFPGRSPGTNWVSSWEEVIKKSINRMDKENENYKAPEYVIELNPSRINEINKNTKTYSNGEKNAYIDYIWLDGTEGENEYKSKFIHDTFKDYFTVKPGGGS